MVRKKIDNRIRVLIENGVTIGHRTMFIVVGNKARDQVVILHHMLSKAVIRARPNVLWCYKKDLDFSRRRKKKMKILEKKIKSGGLEINEDDPFELFVASTNIRYCYYAETHKILGNTYGMCVLQDFEALTPNLLARTVETVEGGGIIVLLLQSVSSLRQLYTMSMDVHERYRTEAHQNVVGRFNERFILSLSSCSRCLVVDDHLAVLPLSSHNLDIEPINKSTIELKDEELESMKETMQDTQPVGCLINCCKTVDQAKALLKFIDAISEKSLRATVSLTASRGRGKSAALGLSIASAVAFGYSNIFVTSPSPENLKTLFEFVFKGFDALEYQEHLDYDLVQSTNPEFNKAVVCVNIFKNHRQTVQYIHPTDAHRLGQAELVVIDEAAAIPLPLVKSMLGPYLVFLSSTINGYEGTGRSLSLKLIQQLRTQACSGSSSKNSTLGRTLHEVTLNESIRYKPNDAVEKWLTDVLCLDATSVPQMISGCPPPESCDLYYINRDTLFCYHKASEAFLQRLVSLYVSSHYKNSCNDLQMISDAPAHHLFCLLGPVDPNKSSLPEILVVIQVCLEGHVSKNSVSEGLSRGRRAAGDLIPWTIAQQYQDEDFPMLCGARIVRIATHPDCQSMGYGSRALQLLKQYYNLEFVDPDMSNTELPESIDGIPEEEVGLLEEKIEPRKTLPPLLLKLVERSPERLDYLGVSFGLTSQLLKFWKKSGFVPVYLRQTTSDLTGEHSCILLHILHSEDIPAARTQWLNDYWCDFSRRFISLLGYQFRSFVPALALSVLNNKNIKKDETDLSYEELNIHFTKYDVKRLEMYSNNMADYHLIIDLLPQIARLYFLKKLGNVHMSAVQAAILLGLGLQHKTVDTLSSELELPSSQLLGLFNRIIRRCLQYLSAIIESTVSENFKEQTSELPNSVKLSLEEELNEVAEDLKKKQKLEFNNLMSENLSQYSIKGSDEDWKKALSKGSKSIISVKSAEKRSLTTEKEVNEKHEKKNKTNHKHKNAKRSKM